MWMSWYEQEMLMRQQIAEAQRRAAHDRLARETSSPPAPRDGWRRFARLFRRPLTPTSVLVPQTKAR